MPQHSVSQEQSAIPAILEQKRTQFLLLATAFTTFLSVNELRLLFRPPEPFDAPPSPFPINEK